jgi:hypothetical protein
VEESSKWTFKTKSCGTKQKRAGLQTSCIAQKTDFATRLREMHERCKEVEPGASNAQGGLIMGYQHSTRPKNKKRMYKSLHEGSRRGDSAVFVDRQQLNWCPDFSIHINCPFPHQI